MVIRVGGDPVPGVCEGLTQGVIGMTVGSKRRIVVPPEEVGSGGWQDQAVSPTSFTMRWSSSAAYDGA